MLLNVVPVTITADNGNAVSTYAFLDNGCTDTLIDRELAEYLGLQGSPEQIGISTSTDSENLVESNRVSFTLSSADGSGEDIHVTDAYVLPDLNQSQRILPEEIDVRRYSHLQDIDFPAVDIRRVSILVGSNIPYPHIQKEVGVPEDKKRGLYGCRYALGWCVSGPYDVKRRQGITANFVSLSQMPDDFIQRFWNLEDYGAVNSGEKPLSVEDKRALKIIEDTTRLVGGHYEVGLLWKNDERMLPNNHTMANQRSESLRRRLTKLGNEQMAIKYREVHVHLAGLTTDPVEVKIEGSALKPTEGSAESPMQVLITSCSDWTRLRRRVAWFLRFAQFMQDKKTARTGRLTIEDYDAATLAMSRIVQKVAYSHEIKDLKMNGVIKSSSKIAALNPELDAYGVLRVNGRGRHMSVASTAGQQIILARHHPVASLIVRHMHHCIGHLGREHVMARLRENFWIPQACVLVRSVLDRCLKCKKLNARPITQQMAPLPKARLMAYEPPFSCTGMDLFGPLYVKHGRGTAKRWCCLFTCLTTRCVHLELVNSVETDDFIMCLRRFINRRGDVKELRCDNGSNFVGGERELRKSLQEWNHAQIEQELIQAAASGSFNRRPPRVCLACGNVWYAVRRQS